jgi:hypothetical protein
MNAILIGSLSSNVPVSRQANTILRFYTPLSFYVSHTSKECFQKLPIRATDRLAVPWSQGSAPLVHMGFSVPILVAMLSARAFHVCRELRYDSTGSSDGQERLDCYEGMRLVWCEFGYGEIAGQRRRLFATETTKRCAIHSKKEPRPSLDAALKNESFKTADSFASQTSGCH